MKKHHFVYLAGALILVSVASKPLTVSPLILPFQYRGYIILNAKINGVHNARVLLDTGADELLLDEEYFYSKG